MSTHEEFTTTAAPAKKSPWYRRRAPLACTAAAVTLAGALAFAVPLTAAARVSDSGSTAATVSDTRGAAYGYGGWQGSGSAQGGTSTRSQTGTTTQEEATTATDTESTGVVLINTDLGYYDASAVGTGMVLTSDGLILTNNHVVSGATEITVTIPSTGETYTATVVGTDSEDDVALLQLTGASDLTTVTIDDDETDAAGDAITAVGNAEGGGVLLAADGTITALDATVTTSAEALADSETLDGMIEISADVVSGDSGGALLDDDGEVIGMTTAASSGTATVTAYAIPIEDVLDIVDQILAGDETDGGTLGYPAFLGVYFSSSTSTTTGGYGTRSFGGAQGFGGTSTSTSATTGAVISGVLEGTPAATAGLVAGDTIAAVDGVAVTDSTSLSTLLESYEPGDTVTVTYVDTTGTTQSTSVTLIEGPVS